MLMVRWVDSADVSGDGDGAGDGGGDDDDDKDVFSSLLLPFLLSTSIFG